MASVTRVQRRHIRNGERPATLLELLAQRRIGEREQHHARIAHDLLDDTLKMLLGADHRPEMPDRLDILELRDRRLADMLQRLAGGVRRGGGG